MADSSGDKRENENENADAIAGNEDEDPSAVTEVDDMLGLLSVRQGTEDCADEEEGAQSPEGDNQDNLDAEDTIDICDDFILEYNSTDEKDETITTEAVRLPEATDAAEKRLPESSDIITESHIDPKKPRLDHEDTKPAADVPALPPTQTDVNNSSEQVLNVKAEININMPPTTIADIEILDSSDDEERAVIKTSSDVHVTKLDSGATLSKTITPATPMDVDSSSNNEINAQGSDANTDMAKLIKTTSTTTNTEPKSLNSNDAMETFNLDSDDDEMNNEKNETENNQTAQQETFQGSCIHPDCPRTPNTKMVQCPYDVLGYLKIKRQKQDGQLYVCEICLNNQMNQINILCDYVLNGLPLLGSDFPTTDNSLKDDVEVIDSDSDNDADDEEFVPLPTIHPLPDYEMEYLNDNLNNTFEDILRRTHFEGQIDLCKKSIIKRVDLFEESIDDALKLAKEVQSNTDNIKKMLYDEIKIETKLLPDLMMPYEYEDDDVEPPTQAPKNSLPTEPEVNGFELDEYLPPPGRYTAKPLNVGDSIYTIKHSICGSWIPATIQSINPVGALMGNDVPLMFSLMTVKLTIGGKQTTKQVNGRQVAYNQPFPVRYPIATRVIALFKDMVTIVKKESYYSGVIAEPPSPLNKFRYLVFFDDGYSQYVHHKKILPVAETSPKVWEDVHPDSREFIKKYLCNYPERPMVRMQPGQIVKTEKNGSWWDATVITLDASLALLRFKSASTRDEWIYRGSTRLSLLYQQLQAAERRTPGRQRPMGAIASRHTGSRLSIPYVEYTRNDDEEVTFVREEKSQVNLQPKLEKPRAVAKKSTGGVVSSIQDLTPETMDYSSNQVKSRIVYFSPKLWIKPKKMVPHRCNQFCLSPKALPLANLKTYNPLSRPLLSGFERLTFKHKYLKDVMYSTPCGRKLRSIVEVHKYLCETQSTMSVDLFDFSPKIQCLSEFALVKCYVSKLDISHGAEAVPVPCVNYYNQTLPEFWKYNMTRNPILDVKLNLNEDFLCACDCTDDCQDKDKCQCWQMTYEGARVVKMDTKNLGYQYKRLMEPVSTGIYECNSRCKCRNTCLNRVVQHPLQLKLQVFQTFNRGWGIRALNDVARGTFICIYAGKLLTDAVANRGGKITDGDKYLADLDYIEVVERLKEDYESDVEEEIKKLDKKEGKKSGEDDSDEQSDNEDGDDSRNESDEEFNPDGIIMSQSSTNGRRLRPRKRNKKNSNDPKPTPTAPKPAVVNEDESITISDDELREPSRFAAPEGFKDDDEPALRHKSVREYYGEDEAVYIMDARLEGNIGRYLNHSCDPNVFVQNVFVDTQDPRFPWVSFFAGKEIRAGTELTWHYNYDIGSVPGKVIYCKCGSAVCRGRLL